MTPIKVLINGISSIFNVLSDAITFISNIINGVVNAIVNNPVVKAISGVVS